MIERPRLFDTAMFRWIPARTRVDVEYCASLRSSDSLPVI
jgi:hypothetical protein